MATHQISFRAYKRDTFLSLRLLGAIGMIGAPMLLFETVYRYLAQISANQNTQVVGVLSIIYICGWVCSAIGMRRLRVTGNGFWAKAIFAIQMAGLILAGLWAVHEALNLTSISNVALFGITDAAWPLSHLFMLVVGGFAWKTGVWSGWRILAIFLCGLPLIAFFAINGVVGRDIAAALFVAVTAIGFTMLGYAVRASRDV